MKIVKEIISILIMIIIAPMIVVITLSILNPAEFGGGPNIKNILAMYVFGLITVPMWLTYIPSIILTPIIMRRIDKQKEFHELPIRKIILLSTPVGALCGVLILFPVLLPVFIGSSPLLSSWVFAGVVSGSITLTLIALIYRLGNRISSNKALV